MRRLNLDDLSPLGMRVFEGIWETRDLKRAQCSRIDMGSGFIGLAVHHKLRMYFNLSDELWAAVLEGVPQ